MKTDSKMESKTLGGRRLLRGALSSIQLFPKMTPPVLLENPSETGVDAHFSVTYSLLPEPRIFLPPNKK